MKLKLLQRKCRGFSITRWISHQKQNIIGFYYSIIRHDQLYYFVIPHMSTSSKHVRFPKTGLFPDFQYQFKFICNVWYRACRMTYFSFFFVIMDYFRKLPYFTLSKYSNSTSIEIWKHQFSQYSLGYSPIEN